MSGQAGDRIIVESERVGKASREGEILDTRESPVGPTYQVRWNDGSETEFRPASGSARIVPKPKERPKASSRR